MLQGESHILHIQSWITIQVKAGFSEENPFPPILQKLETVKFLVSA